MTSGATTSDVTRPRRRRDPRSSWSKAVAGLPLWVVVTGVFLALRAVSWVLLERAADDQVWAPGVTGPRADDIRLTDSWDAMWYQRIAEDGYPDTLPVGPDGRVQQNPWAFYPLFPYAVRVAMRITGAEFATVAPLLALLAGVGAAVVMAHLLRATLPTAGTGPVVGVVAVWAAFPTSPVLQMAYTESFAVLLLVAVLLLLVRRRWWAAAAVALLLGLTRPIALPLALVVAVAVWLRWRARRTEPIGRAEGAGLAGVVVATGVSGLLWTALAWLGTGDRAAYPHTMEAWRGEAALRVGEPWLRKIRWAWEYHDRVFVLPSLGLVLPLALATALFVPRFAPAVDLRLKVWSLAYAAYLLAVVDGHTSIFRYLVPLFPLAIVLVGAHRAVVSRWWTWRTAFWVAAGVLGQVGWIWWLVLFTPPADFPP